MSVEKEREKLIGDKAGEYLEADRGMYNAWAHVIVSFIYFFVFIGCFIAYIFSLFGIAATTPYNTETALFLVMSLILGILFSIIVYWDRWRVNEAFSSRFCSGSGGISLIYVPIIALCYAIFRGLKKLFKQ
jgi:hypothetical protein